jgi:hypothetical protein
VLEAKLLGPAGVVVSLGSEFIENADAAGAQGQSAEAVKPPRLRGSAGSRQEATGGV